MRRSDKHNDALEADAKPYLVLVSILNDHRRTYYTGGQTLLATWPVKTALVAGSKFNAKTPRAFYRDLYESAAPSPRTSVWLGATPWAGFQHIDYRPMKISRAAEPPVRSENAFAGLLALGTIVFYVVSWLDCAPPVEPVGKYSELLLPLSALLRSVPGSAVGQRPAGPGTRGSDAIVMRLLQ